MAKVNLVPFKFEHIVQLGDAAGQMLMPPTEAVLLEREKSLTALTPDGRVIGCAGVVKIWKGRWMAWAHLSSELGALYLTDVVRAVRKFLDDLGPGRVEASVLYGEERFAKFAKACGFTKLETPEPMEKYFPDGASGQLYSRVR
jgi:hypothetical protein